jgi:hypothetical protein
MGSGSGQLEREIGVRLSNMILFMIVRSEPLPVLPLPQRGQFSIVGESAPKQKRIAED